MSGEMQKDVERERFRKLLPREFSYKMTNFDLKEEEIPRVKIGGRKKKGESLPPPPPEIVKGFEATMRIKPLNTEMEFRTWLAEFEQLSDTKWVPVKANPNTPARKYPYNTWKQDYVCQYSSSSEVTSERLLGCCDCLAKMSARLKVVTPKTLSVDELLLDGYICIVTVSWMHTHPYGTLEAKEVLKKEAEVQEEFYRMFESGMSPTEAEEAFGGQLRVATPKFNKIWLWHKKWLLDQKGKKPVRDVSSLIEMLEHRVMDLSLKDFRVGFKTVDLTVRGNTEDVVVVSVVTPLMLRAHRALPWAPKIVFTDYVECPDKVHSVNLIMTTSEVGEIPLGAVVCNSQNQQPVTIQIGYEILKDLLGGEAFGGQLFPCSFVSDEDYSKNTERAIQRVWPESDLLVCRLHRPQEIKLSQAVNYNVVSLLDFVTSELDISFRKKLTEIVPKKRHALETRIKKMYEKSENFGKDDIEELRAGVYVVPCTSRTPFMVIPSRAVCSCHDGAAGKLCKHLVAVLRVYPQLKSTMPDLANPTPTVRHRLAWVALGQECQEKWHFSTKATTSSFVPPTEAISEAVEMDRAVSSVLGPSGPAHIVPVVEQVIREEQVRLQRDLPPAPMEDFRASCRVELKRLIQLLENRVDQFSTYQTLKGIQKMSDAVENSVKNQDTLLYFLNSWGQLPSTSASDVSSREPVIKKKTVGLLGSKKSGPSQEKKKETKTALVNEAYEVLETLIEKDATPKNVKKPASSTRVSPAPRRSSIVTPSSFSTDKPPSKLNSSYIPPGKINTVNSSKSYLKQQPNKCFNRPIAPKPPPDHSNIGSIVEQVAAGAGDVSSVKVVTIDIEADAAVASISSAQPTIAQKGSAENTLTIGKYTVSYPSNAEDVDDIESLDLPPAEKKKLAKKRRKKAMLEQERKRAKASEKALPIDSKGQILIGMTSEMVCSGQNKAGHNEYVKSPAVFLTQGDYL